MAADDYLSDIATGVATDLTTSLVLLVAKSSAKFVLGTFRRASREEVLPPTGAMANALADAERACFGTPRFSRAAQADVATSRAEQWLLALSRQDDTLVCGLCASDLFQVPDRKDGLLSALASPRPRRWVLRGFRLPAGAGESDLLPWIGIDFSVYFHVDRREQLVPLLLWLVPTGGRWVVHTVAWNPERS